MCVCVCSFLKFLLHTQVGMDTLYIVFPCMFCMLLAQSVCHTKDKIIEGREAESQQQTQLLRQCQAECENLSLKIKVSIM